MTIEKSEQATIARPVPAVERLRNADRCLTGAIHELGELRWTHDLAAIERLQRNIRRALAAHEREAAT